MMQCEECGKRPAAVHIIKIDNGAKTDMHLCEVCALQKNPITLKANFSMQDLVAGILKSGSVGPFKVDIVHEVKCDICGLSYSKFKTSGKFGCSNCYKVFGDRLNPLFKRLHGNIIHTGKLPSKAGSKIKLDREIERLRQELQSAVNNEEYEKAAEIRDRIRDINSEEQEEHDGQLD
jgi:protein arginine kinase activator